MSDSTAQTIEKVHVMRTPGLCGGKPCIAGSRIRVQDIYVWHELQGKSPDEIVNSFPQLTLADVYAALAYFWDNREEILRQMKEQDEFVERMKKENPSKLAQRLAQRGSQDALSS
jgi:uncharacterized protein (DUF433 family)